MQTVMTYSQIFSSVTETTEIYKVTKQGRTYSLAGGAGDVSDLGPSGLIVLVAVLTSIVLVTVVLVVDGVVGRESHIVV